MNRLTLIGHMAADPEIRHLPDGGKAATFRVATNEHWKDKATGAMRSRAEFHRIVTYNDALISGVIAPHARKGKQVAIEASVRTRTWVDQGGTQRYTTECVIGPRGSFTLLGQAPAREPVEAGPAEPAQAPAQASDDIPF